MARLLELRSDEQLEQALLSLSEQEIERLRKRLRAVRAREAAQLAQLELPLPLRVEGEEGKE